MQQQHDDGTHGGVAALKATRAGRLLAQHETGAGYLRSYAVRVPLSD